jgi:hypothetical protein
MPLACVFLGRAGAKLELGSPLALAASGISRCVVEMQGSYGDGVVLARKSESRSPST